MSQITAASVVGRGEEPVDELFLQQAQLHPHRLAVAVGSERATYAQLLARVIAIQLALEALPEAPHAVAGYFEHCLDAIAAFLAVLRSGAFFVPLAPVLGKARIAASIQDAGAKLLLSRSVDRKELSGLGVDVWSTDELGDSAGTSLPRRRRQAPAYAIYTSGSTGRPKGVAISHRALSVSTRARRRLYGDGGTLFLAAPLCFDSSISLFGPLSSGGAIRLSSPGSERDALRLAEEASLDATQLLLLPSVYGEVLEVWGERQPPGLGVAIVAGEAVPPRLVQRHFALAPSRRLVNEYGPTEATVFCTAHECRPVDATAPSVPIGYPAEGYEIALLGPDGVPVTPGQLGEIHVGGEALAEGYLGNPGLTARRFVPARNGRLYRTGDLGRRREDGAIEFHGRADDQIKVRGIRVELGEVERMLERIPQVLEAAAVVIDTQLVGYVRVREEERFDAETERRELLESVPPYLVPQVLRPVSELPRTSTGKVDRGALIAQGRLLAAAPEASEPAGQASTSPEDEALAAVIQAVTEVIGRRPSLDAPFVSFGDSLLAMRVAVRLHGRGWYLDPTVLLDGRSLSGAAQSLTRKSEHTVAAGELGRLAPNQLGIWFVENLARGTNVFLVPLRLRIEGPMDEARLQRAIATVVQRHPVLGCQIGKRGREPVMLPSSEPVRLDTLELAKVGGSVDELAHAEAGRPIDLRREPILRSTLVRLGPDRWELFLTLHHLGFDGWSQQVLVRDLAEAYKADGSPLTQPPPPDFRQYAARLRAADDRGDYTADARAVAKLLEGIPTLLLLEPGEASPMPGFMAQGVVIDLDASLRVRLERLAQERRTTLFVVLLTGFAMGVAQLTGERSFIIGSVSANRPSPELEDAVGFFTNVVPMGLALPPVNEDTVTLVDRVRDRVLAALRFGHVPLSRVVEAVAPERKPGHAPLVQVLFEYFGESLPPVELGTARAEWADDGFQQGAVSELSIRVFPRGSGLRCVLVHDASIIRATTADALLRAAQSAWSLLAGG